MRRGLLTLAAIALAAIALAAIAGSSAALAQTRACGPQTTEVMTVGASTLCLHIEEATAARMQLLQVWVRRSADIVAQWGFCRNEPRNLQVTKSIETCSSFRAPKFS